MSDLPTIDFPTIQVQASLPGASPETMASSVATPLEKQFSTIAGVDVDQLTSNAQGSTNITLQFDLDRDIDAAAQDVQSMIAQTQRGSCRPACRRRRRIQKVNPADSPILFLTLSSQTLPLSQVDEYAETIARAAALDGQRRGAGQRLRRAEVRRPRRRRPARAGVAADRHRPGRAGDPAGERQPADRDALRPRPHRSSCRPSGQLTERRGYAPVVVAYRNGSPVRLDEVAHVYDGVENDKTASWFNGIAHDLPRDPAPAGHQHGRGRRRDPGAAAAARSAAAGIA